MSSPAQFPTPQFLAEHHHFVRRLALGLARDEASAEDLVQETWLAAVLSGSHSIVHPRAWLATAMRRRALNHARSENVRREHEGRAVRGESSEDARLHERVSFQQRGVRVRRTSNSQSSRSTNCATCSTGSRTNCARAC